MIVAYVSGHGYGHATRVGEALRCVRERVASLPIAIVTSGPEALYREAIPGPFLFRPVECDVGVVQKDALTIDEAGTLARWRSFHRTWDSRVSAESAWLTLQRARVVLGDIPPLAFAAASQAGIQSLALANFSWDWIYRSWSSRHIGFEEAARAAEKAYARAGLLLELPFAGDLRAFPSREAIPLVARRPRLSRAEARCRLGADGRPLVLLSFGGLGLEISPERLRALKEFQFVFPGHLPTDGLAALGMGYADLVGAADVVVTKPGYGIVSDAIGAGTRLVYTDRGDFPEYPILVREMSSLLPCAYVSNEDLRTGRLAGPIRDVLQREVPPPPDMGGADKLAERLLERAS